MIDDSLIDIVEIERHIFALFKLDTKIKSVIATGIPVSRTAEALVFLTNKQQLFCYIDSPMKLTLRDIQKIIRRMNLTPLSFLPPNGDADYFDEIARNKYNKTFPGMKHVSDEDLHFYRTMAPYCPALVQISEIKSGVINQYDASSYDGWRPSIKYSYRLLQAK